MLRDGVGMDYNKVIEQAEKENRITLSPEIKSIAQALERGNSIEIHPAKDGVRIYEVKKKVIV